MHNNRVHVQLALLFKLIINILQKDPALDDENLQTILDFIKMITTHITDRDRQIIKFYNIDDESTKAQIMKNKSMTLSTLSAIDD